MVYFLKEFSHLFSHLCYDKPNIKFYNFQVFNLSNYFSGQEAAGFPRLNTCFNWFQRIDICVGGSVVETLYPKEQLLLYNLFLSENYGNQFFKCNYFAYNNN